MRFKGFVEGGGAVDVQVVHDPADFTRVLVAFIHHGLDKMRPVHGLASPGYFHMALPGAQAMGSLVWPIHCRLDSSMHTSGTAGS